jgi:putative transposase
MMIMQNARFIKQSYDRHDQRGNNSGNSRNAKSRKTLKGDFVSRPLEVPRDRNSTFKPQIIPKGETHLKGFDDKILSL